MRGMRARQWCSGLSTAPPGVRRSSFAAASVFGRLCSLAGGARLCSARQTAVGEIQCPPRSPLAGVVSLCVGMHRKYMYM